jgi:hypothetical protein
MAEFRSQRCATNCSYDLTTCGLINEPNFSVGGPTVWVIPSSKGGGFLSYNYTVKKAKSSGSPSIAYYQIVLNSLDKIGGGGSLNLQKAFNIGLTGNQDEYSKRRTRWEREVIARITNNDIIPNIKSGLHFGLGNIWTTLPRNCFQNNGGSWSTCGTGCSANMLWIEEQGVATVSTVLPLDDDNINFLFFWDVLFPNASFGSCSNASGPPCISTFNHHEPSSLN